MFFCVANCATPAAKSQNVERKSKKILTASRKRGTNERIRATNDYNPQKEIK